MHEMTNRNTNYNENTKQTTQKLTIRQNSEFSYTKAG